MHVAKKKNSRTSAPATDSATSVTLLMRLRDPADGAAWDDFLRRYAPRIFQWCRRFGLQESDAADVTQDVLAKLVQAMRNFRYDAQRGSFRGWMKTVTRNAVLDLQRAWSRQARGSGDTRQLRRLHAIQDPNALEELAREVEAEHERELLAAAEQRVRLRVQDRTWNAYALTTQQNVSPADAAEQTGLRVAEVYVAKSRVLKMLREEVRRLENSAADPSLPPDP